MDTEIYFFTEITSERKPKSKDETLTRHTTFFIP